MANLSIRDIMLYPSLFEGFGLPILESLFSKTIVINSKGGCFAELQRKTLNLHQSTMY